MYGDAYSTRKNLARLAFTSLYTALAKPLLFLRKIQFDMLRKHAVAILGGGKQVSGSHINVYYVRTRNYYNISS